MTYEKFIELGGNSEIPQAVFTNREAEYISWINYYTFDRINYLDPVMIERVNRNLVELINKSHSDELERKSNIKSESVGSHRVDYTVEDNKTYNARLDAETYDIIRKYWAHTGLMYRGV